MKTNPKKNIQRVGYLLAVIALFLVGKSFYEQKESVLSSISLQQAFVVSFAGGSVYLVANLILGFAWARILWWFGEKDVTVKEHIGIYGRSQILKYLPGNVVSILGRHLSSTQKGMRHDSLIAAAGVEVIGLFLMAILISFLKIGSLTKDGISNFSLYFVVSILLFSLLFPKITSWLYRNFRISQKIKVLQIIGESNHFALLKIWLLYAVFFLLTGLILFLMLSYLGIQYHISFFSASSIFAIGWLGGFVAFGAPGGLGVREGILILLLSNYTSEPLSILISLLLRLITLLGDVFFFLVSLWLVRE